MEDLTLYEFAKMQGKSYPGVYQRLHRKKNEWLIAKGHAYKDPDGTWRMDPTAVSYMTADDSSAAEVEIVDDKFPVPAKLMEQIDTLKQEISSLRDEKEGLLKKIIVEQEKTTLLLTEKSNQQQLLLAEKATQAELKASLDYEKKMTERLESDLSEKKAEIEKKTAENQEINQKLMESQSENKSKDDEIKKLIESLDLKQTEIDELNEELNKPFWKRLFGRK